MGRLEQGSWIAEEDFATILRDMEGEYRTGGIRGRISSEKNSPFPPEAGRYHLFISYACPQAHCAFIIRKLKGLEKIISASSVSPHISGAGWTFKQDFPDSEADAVEGRTYLRDYYLQSDPHYSGRVTVPLLWDKVNKEIVSNNAVDIVRMFDVEFNQLTGNTANFYPRSLQKKIDELLAFILQNIGLGVYKTILAASPSEQEKNCQKLFNALARIDRHLQEKTSLGGTILTEADWFLFTLLIRFDPVFYPLITRTKKRMSAMPTLVEYTKKLYDYPGIKETTKFDHSTAYFRSGFPALFTNTLEPRLPLGPDHHFPSEQEQH